MTETFMECKECAAKSGSPILCESCLHNRDLVCDLQGRPSPSPSPLVIAGLLVIFMAVIAVILSLPIIFYG